MKKVQKVAMKNINLVISFVLVLLITISCSTGDRRLEQALTFAGDNRRNWKKYLHIIAVILKSWKRLAS